MDLKFIRKIISHEHLKNNKEFAMFYINKIGRLSIVIFLLFILSIYFGYLLAEKYPDMVEKIIFEALKNELSPIKEYSSFKLWFFIFYKNLTVVLMGAVLGIFFGIAPILIVLSNGLMLGVVSFFFLKESNLLVLMAGLLPHGIIEIPAFIFAIAGSLRLLMVLYRYIAFDENKLKEEVFLFVKFLITVIIPMLFIAAFIESYITSRVINLVMFIS